MKHIILAILTTLLFTASFAQQTSSDVEEVTLVDVVAPTGNPAEILDDQKSRCAGGFVVLNGEVKCVGSTPSGLVGPAPVTASNLQIVLTTGTAEAANGVIVDFKPLTSSPEGVEFTSTDRSLEITSSEIPKVATVEEIVVEGDKLAVVVGTETKEINIFPHDLPKIANIEIEKAELKVENEKPIYAVSGVADAKIFGIIEVAMPVTKTVDAASGEIVQVQKPFWGFLAAEIQKPQA